MADELRYWMLDAELFMFVATDPLFLAEQSAFANEGSS
jgi:hypothetical protein